MSHTPAPMSGAKWRATHQRSVDSILGAGVRKVYSRGSRFYNVDHWPARTFISHLCEWARLNRGARPTRGDVVEWLRISNDNPMREDQKHIVIAATPDELPSGLARALVGGGYHEAWHTKYSLRRNLSIHEVCPKVLDYWDRIPWDPSKKMYGWASLGDMVLNWSNIIEDIRIERIGCREFPGTPASMEALQDLILRMENEIAIDGMASENSLKLTVLASAFRDLGLGYTTNLQKLALSKYEERCPEAWKMVTEGSLKVFLDKAISLGPKDDMDSLWLAMDIVSKIWDLANNPSGEGASDGDADSGEGSSSDNSSDQAEASGKFGEEVPEGSKGKGKSNNKKPVLFKVGDRAKIKSSGEEVEVVKASLPDPKTGIQDLEWVRAN